VVEGFPHSGVHRAFTVMQQTKKR